MANLIAPSLLSADFANLKKEIKDITAAGADWLHWDVMDGAFVPNITFGMPVIKSLRKHSKLLFDVHLMINHSQHHLKAFADAGADSLTVHLEATKHLDSLLGQIKDLGLKAGVALNPSTPVESLNYILDKVDLILVMTVNPGFGGQKFLRSQLNKIKTIKKIIQGRDILIQVDGGINKDTATLVCQAGADVLVAGNYIFNANNYQQAIAELRN